MILICQERKNIFVIIEKLNKQTLETYSNIFFDATTYCRLQVALSSTRNSEANYVIMV